MSAIKGEYRLARVREVYPDTKGLVRSAKVAYTIYKVGEKTGSIYAGSRKQEVIHPVQRLALLLPVD